MFTFYMPNPTHIRSSADPARIHHPPCIIMCSLHSISLTATVGNGHAVVGGVVDHPTSIEV